MGRVETHRLILSRHDARVRFSQLADIFVGFRGISFYVFFPRTVELTMRVVEAAAPLPDRVTSTALIPIS